MNEMDDPEIVEVSDNSGACRVVINLDGSNPRLVLTDEWRREIPATELGGVIVACWSQVRVKAAAARARQSAENALPESDLSLEGRPISQVFPETAVLAALVQGAREERPRYLEHIKIEAAKIETIGSVSQGIEAQISGIVLKGLTFDKTWLSITRADRISSAVNAIFVQVSDLASGIEEIPTDRFPNLAAMREMLDAL